MASSKASQPSTDDENVHASSSLSRHLSRFPSVLPLQEKDTVESTLTDQDTAVEEELPDEEELNESFHPSNKGTIYSNYKFFYSRLSFY